MGISSVWGILFNLVFAILHFKLSHSATVVVDGVSKWRNPTVQIGDSVIFQHKYQYNLYIFQNQEAFSLCNFTQATLLTKANSTSYTWHPSRTGFFYFSFNNGSNKACQEGQKLAVKVTLPPPPPDQPPVPAPPRSSGGSVSSSPAFPWPFRPRETTSPSPAPTNLMFPATSPMVPDTNGIPFINSNPAVPLPTGEVDSATIRPFQISGCHERKVLWILSIQRALCCVFLLMIL